MRRFENRDDLARALAQAVASDLADVIADKGTATLAVSGGTTPRMFFECLSEQDIAWRNVKVTLVDERQVDEASPRSNARLVKAALMQNKAAAAVFVPLHQNADVAAALDLDVVVLGMGNDGHTASFFPGGDRLAQALDVNSKDGIVSMTAVGAGEPRLSFTAAKLLGASSLFLHIEGRQKRDVLDKARSGTDVMDMPIRAVLHSNHPLQIYWCP